MLLGLGSHNVERSYLHPKALYEDIEFELGLAVTTRQPFTPLQTVHDLNQNKGSGLARTGPRPVLS